MVKIYTSLSVCMLTMFSASAAWDGTAQEWSNGDGSQENPYLIETEQHLAYFQQQVTDGETYAGKFFRLENDLDMSADAGYKILPIGFFDEYVDTTDPEGGLIDDSKYFLGCFDGNYKVIDNIHIEYVVSDDSAVGGTGLFACLDDGSVVKNLGLGSNAIITGGELTGSLVGQMNGGTLQNCYSFATVNSSSTFGTGGLVAVSSGAKIEQCFFGGSLKGNSDMGGIVGTAMYQSQITNCYNKGIINTPNGWFVGGICGSAYDEGTRFENCYNIGSVTAPETFISKPEAIVGDAEAGKVLIQNCYFLNDDVLKETSGVTVKSEEEMKDPAMIALLNAGQNDIWATDDMEQNNGFPVLAWQNKKTDGISPIMTMQPTIGVRGNTIIVSDTQSVAVYDLSGKLIFKGVTNNINLNNSGVYIVRIGNHTTKVFVK